MINNHISSIMHRNNELRVWVSIPAIFILQLLSLFFCLGKIDFAWLYVDLFGVFIMFSSFRIVSIFDLKKIKNSKAFFFLNVFLAYLFSMHFFVYYKIHNKLEWLFLFWFVFFFVSILSVVLFVRLSAKSRNNGFAGSQRNECGEE